MITTIGIPTRDRVRSLGECLESYLENCRRHARSPEFVVADGSCEENSKLARALLGRFARQFGARIRYAGRLEKEKFCDLVAEEAGVSREIVRFALFGDEDTSLATGANRNTLLLDAAGTLLLTVDDDTRCRIAASPDQRTELSFFSGYDPTEFWFFADRGRGFESLSFIDADLLVCHETLLGRSTGEDGRVRMTIPGLAGDSGMSSNRYYLALTGASHDRLVASEGSYRRALVSREILRCVRQPTISASPFCMSTFLGLDHRELLPPFFPMHRNSDGIFGYTLHKCVPRCRSGFVPWILVHAPEPVRTFAPDEMWRDADSMRMSDVLIAAVLSKQVEDAQTGARLAALGKHLEWLGSLKLGEFEEYIRTVQEFRNFGFITNLHTQLQTYGASPQFWAADVSRMIERMSQSSNRDDYIVPVDLPLSGDAARLHSQQLVAKFGVLMQAWPAIFEAAARLRANGIRLSREIN